MDQTTQGPKNPPFPVIDFTYVTVLGLPAPTLTFPIFAPDGDASNPQYSFSSENSYGFYYDDTTDPALPVIGVAIETNPVVFFNRDQTVFFGQLRAPDGSDITPTYSFNNASSTGMYMAGVGTQLVFVLFGNLGLLIDQLFIQSPVPYYANDGTRFEPVYTFTGSIDTGLFKSGTGLGITDSSDFVAEFRSGAGVIVPNGTGFFIVSNLDPSGGTRDIGFSRYDVGVAMIDDGTGGYGKLVVDELWVNNSAVATTPGTVQNKIEVFDSGGSSLGFIPVYDAIV